MRVRGITQETWKVVLMGPKAESGKARSEPGNSQNLYFIFLSYIATNNRQFHTFKGNSGRSMASMGELMELVGRWRGRARMSRTQPARAVCSGHSRWNAWIWCCLLGSGHCPCFITQDGSQWDSLSQPSI